MRHTKYISMILLSLGYDFESMGYVRTRIGITEDEDAVEIIAGQIENHVKTHTASFMRGMLYGFIDSAFLFDTSNKVIADGTHHTVITLSSYSRMSRLGNLMSGDHDICDHNIAELSDEKLMNLVLGNAEMLMYFSKNEGEDDDD